MNRFAVAVVAIAACSHTAPPPTAPAADAAADLLAFLPANSDVIVDIDYHAVTSSALWRELGAPVTDAVKAGMSSVAWRDCVFGDVGALDHMTAAFVGDRTVGVLRSHHAPQMFACLETELAKDGAKVVRDRGAVVAWIGSKAFAFAEASPSTIVMDVGATPGRDSLAALIASGAPLRTSRDFMRRHHETSQGAALWIWASGDAKVLASLGIQARELDIAVTATDKLSATVHVDLASSDAANELAAMLRPQLGTARPMFEKLELSASESTLHLVATANVAQLRQLLTLVGVTTTK